MSSRNRKPSSNSPTSILLADDHTLVSESIKDWLEKQPQLKVIGIVSTGEEAISIARQLQPNIVLMDINMPGMGGLEATRKLKVFCKQTKVIILSTYQNDIFSHHAIKAGAFGYVTKSSIMENIMDAISVVNDGQTYITKDLSNQVAINSILPAQEKPFQSLTIKEFQIFFMIIRGDQIRSIASKLHLANKTINHYRYRIFDKLKIKSDVELTHLAAQYDLIDKPHHLTL